MSFVEVSDEHNGRLSKGTAPGNHSPLTHRDSNAYQYRSGHNESFGTNERKNPSVDTVLLCFPVFWCISMLSKLLVFLLFWMVLVVGSVLSDVGAHAEEVRSMSCAYLLCAQPVVIASVCNRAANLGKLRETLKGYWTFSSFILGTAQTLLLTNPAFDKPKFKKY
eukprot:3307553-Amphidinium_carterae.1